MDDSASALESLRDLSEAFTMGPARSGFVRALDLLIDHMPGRAATLILSGQIEVERGFPLESHAEAARTPAVELARQAVAAGQVIEVIDTRRGPFTSREDGVALHASGYTAALAVPIHERNRSFGAIVVWFDELYRAPRHATSLLWSVAYQMASALARDIRPAADETSLASLGEMNRLASLGLLLDTSLHALRAPSSSLLIQIDELRRLLSELSLIADPSDMSVQDVVQELVQTVDDMGIASAVVRRELTRLADFSEKSADTGQVQLSLIVHEAVTIARPELEQRGFTIEEIFARDSYVNGDQHELLQLTLGLLFAIGRDPQIHGQFPLLEVHLGGRDGEAELRVVARASFSHFMPPLSTTPDHCARIIAAHHGDVSEALGSLTVRLPTTGAAAELPPPSASVAPRVRKVLLVDDDPMFTRALRRALTPHDVRLCGTAAEAEIALLSPDYEPDLVVCDLWLPGTNGRSLHEKVTQNHPELASKFVFVSGAPMTSRDVDYFTQSGCRNLTKPIRVEDILSLLDGDSPQKRPSFGPFGSEFR